MAELIELDGKKFVVGLDWKTLNKVDVASKKVDYAKHGGVIVSHKNNNDFIMVGEAKEGDDVTGECSLAVKLSRHTSGVSVLAIIALPEDKYWYVLMQNGMPVVGSDRIVDRDTMESKADRYQTAIPGLIYWGNGAREIAVLDGAQQDAMKDDLGKIFAERCRALSKVTNTPFSHSSKIFFRYVVYAGAIALAWFLAISPAIDEYQAHKKAQEREEQKESKQVKNALAQFKKEKAKYESAMIIGDFHSNLFDSWALRSPLFIDGWEAKTASCKAGACSTTYSVNTPSPVTGINLALKEVCPKPILGKGNSSITCSYQMGDKTQKTIEFTKVPPVADLREQFMLLKRHKATSMVFAEPTVRKTKIKAPDILGKKVHDFEKTQFSISISAFDLPVVMALLKNYPSLYIEKAEFSYAQRTVLLSFYFVKKI